MNKSAKVLAPRQLRALLAHARRCRYPERNAVIILLSFKAGLRACEIAGLDWRMLCAPVGQISSSIAVAHTIAKNGRGRRVPLHPELKAALVALRRTMSFPTEGPVVRSLRGGHMTPRSVVNLFATFYSDLGFDGCSSHSGRRTFITNSARLIAKVGGSLRDIQELAGHSALTTTERYIEGDREAQRKLVRLL